MKAIITNHKRSAVCNQELTLAGLQDFIKSEFPRYKEPILMFKDVKGEEININSEEEVSLLKKMFNGQNFVEISLGGKHVGHGHGHRRHHSHSKGKHHGGKAHRQEKRTNVLAKIYGGEPSEYEAFEQEHSELHMGKLIKAFAEKNGIEKPNTKCERKTNVLAKVYGGEPSDFKAFYEQNNELKVGELIRKYADEKGIEMKDKKPWNQEKQEARIQKKIQRLSVALGNPHEVYDQAAALIKENPQLNVKQILEKLQKEGKDVNMEKFFEMRRKEREEFGSQKKDKSQKKDRSTKKEKSRKKEKVEKKEEILQVKEETPKLKIEGGEEKPKKNNKQEEMREKGRILMEMKEIFGKERTTEYFKFINENFQAGEAGIIEKWIHTHEI